jgi:hypothetical protein
MIAAPIGFLVGVYEVPVFWFVRRNWVGDGPLGGDAVWVWGCGDDDAVVLFESNSLASAF